MKICKKIIAAISVFYLFFLALEAQGATINVTRFNDPTPDGCQVDDCSLREAVILSNETNLPDTIVLLEGEYLLEIPEAGTPESGDLNINGPPANGDNTLTISGAGSDKTFITAAPALGSRVVQLGGDIMSLTLNDLTIQNGKTTSGGGGLSTGATEVFLTLNNVNFLNNEADTSSGGAALINGGEVSININGGNFSGNRADADGGALLITSGTVSLNIDGGTFSGNRAGSNGGALHISGGGDSSTSDQIRNVIITDNHAESGAGGGILHSGSRGLIMSNARVTSNTAGNGVGGGIFASNGSSVACLFLTDSLVQNNQSTSNGGGAYCSCGAHCRIHDSVLMDNRIEGSGAGGGLYVSNGGQVEIINSTFSRNTISGTGDGGGLFGSNGQGITILNSTFSENEATNGGGIWEGGGSPFKEITNSTFSGNQADNEGGGLRIDKSDIPTLNNVTFAGNSAAVGGGVFSPGGDSNIIRNSVFFENEGGGSTDDCAGVFDSDGYNIFGSPDNAGCSAVAENNSTDQFIDPVIGLLADNGGLTETRALLAGSPAIDGGNPGGCEADDGSILTEDQRGQIRSANGEPCDIGAYEVGVLTLAIQKTVDNANPAQGDTVTFTVTVSNNGPSKALKTTMTDTLPAGLDFQSANTATGVCDTAGSTVTCLLDDLDAGNNAVVTIQATVSAEDGDLTNTAVAEAADAEAVESSVAINVGGGGGCGIANHPKNGRAFVSLGWVVLLVSVFFAGKRKFLS
jgi:uncharacterized repeat protein (TIGR01451 family)